MKSSVLAGTLGTDQPPQDFLASAGRIFRVFGAPEQDSGNVSYGVECAGVRYFVKTTDPGARVYLGFEERVALLRNAAEIARSCRHPVLPDLLNVIESPHGPMLVYAWAEGQLLRAVEVRERFHGLPAGEVLRVLDRIYELHARLAALGRVAVDFYDGCLIYDFAGRQLHVVDLDGYAPGPFRNTMGRMFGSSRFMAPEEFELGRWIDERTTVFTLGRTAAVLLSDGTLAPEPFRGHGALHDVVSRACATEPAQRHQTVAAFHDAWRRARAA